jgi:hypothetical protein
VIEWSAAWKTKCNSADATPNNDRAFRDDPAQRITHAERGFPRRSASGLFARGDSVPTVRLEKAAVRWSGTEDGASKRQKCDAIRDPRVKFRGAKIPGSRMPPSWHPDFDLDVSPLSRVTKVAMRKGFALVARSQTAAVFAHVRRAEPLRKNFQSFLWTDHPRFDRMLKTSASRVQSSAQWLASELKQLNPRRNTPHFRHPP